MMTTAFEIKKSAIAPFPIKYEVAVDSFGRLVATYIAELSAWHDHDVKVKAKAPSRSQPVLADFAHITDQHERENAFWQDVAKWDTEKLAHHEPYPKPIANEMIEAAVTARVGEDGTTTYIPNFTVLNDDPTDKEILDQKKQNMFHALLAAEQAAMDKVQMPIGKRRAANLRESDILKADASRHEELAKSGMAASMLEAEVVNQRTSDDTQHLANQKSQRDKVDQIVRAVAKIMSDIEDLTLENIDGFVIPSFD